MLFNSNLKNLNFASFSGVSLHRRLHEIDEAAQVSERLHLLWEA